MKIASTSRSDGTITLTNSENSGKIGLESEITLGLSPLQFDLYSFEVSLSSLYPISNNSGNKPSNTVFLMMTSAIRAVISVDVVDTAMLHHRRYSQHCWSRHHRIHLRIKTFVTLAPPIHSHCVQ